MTFKGIAGIKQTLCIFSAQYNMCWHVYCYEIITLIKTVNTPITPISFPFRLNCLMVPGRSGDALSDGGLAHSSQSFESMGSHSMLLLSGYPNWQHHFEIQPFFGNYSSFIPVLPSVISLQRHSITISLPADIYSVSIWRCYTVLETYVTVLGWRGISFPVG